MIISQRIHLSARKEKTVQIFQIEAWQYRSKVVAKKKELRNYTEGGLALGVQKVG